METEAYRLALKSAFASHYAFLIKTQNFHWNVVGRQFYADHLLFQRIYEEVDSSIDTFAENLRKLDMTAPAGLQIFSQLSVIKDASEMPPSGDVMITTLYRDSEKLKELCQSLYESAEAAKDYNLANFLADRQDAFAKHCWMLESSRL